MALGPTLITLRVARLAALIGPRRFTGFISVSGLVRYLRRIVTNYLRLVAVPLAAAYTGALPKPEDAPAAQWNYVGNEEVKQVLDKAMNWWFDRDYKVSACVDQGGTGKCPCSTDGLWNTNW